MHKPMNWNEWITKPNFSKAIDQTWCKRRVEGHSEWHGYGWCCFDGDDSKNGDCPDEEAQKPGQDKKPKRLLLMMEPDGNLTELLKSILQKYAVSTNDDGQLVHQEFALDVQSFVEQSVASHPKPIDTVVAEPFQQPQPGNYYRPSTLLRPGARVFSTSPELGDSTNGTIGAFLRLKGARKGDRAAWLLSNKHVLLQQEQRLETVEVRGAGQTLISRQVQFRSLGDTVNTVDAAIARVIDSDDIEAVYDGIQIHCPRPMEPRLGMTVYKLGNATGVTRGRIICRLDKVFVEDANKKGAGFEFRDQYLIGSDTTFMASGDSGSLLVGCGHPVALLFAMANNIKGLPECTHFVPPFGLASSIVDVLKQLPKEGASEWELMLDPIHNDYCSHHSTNECGCHEDYCTCYKRYCLCHDEYCPYYCSCEVAPQKHEHCTCKSGHEQYGKECYCEVYHANYRNEPSGHEGRTAEASGPGGDGGTDNPRASHVNQSQRHADEGNPKHKEKGHPHGG